MSPLFCSKINKKTAAETASDSTDRLSEQFFEVSFDAPYCLKTKNVCCLHCQILKLLT